jgi:hypothetical protein
VSKIEKVMCSGKTRKYRLWGYLKTIRKPQVRVFSDKSRIAGKREPTGSCHAGYWRTVKLKSMKPKLHSAQKEEV